MLTKCDTSTAGASRVVRELLDKIRAQDPDAPQMLKAYFNYTFDYCKRFNLFPHINSAIQESSAPGIANSAHMESAHISAPSANAESITKIDPSDVTEEQLAQAMTIIAQNKQNTQIDWAILIDDLVIAAEHIWKDEFVAFAAQGKSLNDIKVAVKDPDRQLRLEFLVQYALTFESLLLEAQYYKRRSDVNFNFYEKFNIQTSYTSLDTQRETQTIVKEFKKYTLGHDKKLADWGQELRSVYPKRLFSRRSSEAEHLKSASKEFSPDHVSAEEVGWIAHAAVVSEELRFRYFNALSRKQLQSRKTFLNALWLLVLRFIIGYGIKPIRFVVTAGIFFVVFSALYGLSDGGSHFLPVDASSVAAMTHSLLGNAGAIFYYFSVALANLTNFGGNFPLGGSQILLIRVFEGLIGYFLFAVLAALLVEQFTEAER